MEHKTLNFEVVKKDDNGGEITISTSAVDRDKDRVIPLGAQVDNYLKNPVVQWGHNYSDPWATIGKTTGLNITEAGIKANFEFREPVNEADPMNIIKALWDGGLINTASVGFNPIKADENDIGGYDFAEWELLEWSLVPIPSNQEALRLAVKSLDTQPLLVVDVPTDDDSVTTTLDVLDEPPEIEIEPEQEPDKTIENSTDDETEKLLLYIGEFLTVIQEALNNG